MHLRLGVQSSSVAGSRLTRRSCVPPAKSHKFRSNIDDSLPGFQLTRCDNRDVAAIALAEANMGDYKLKSAADYEVRYT